MLFIRVITVLALTAAPGLAIPPPIFGFVDSGNHTELTVTYNSNGNSTVIQEAGLYGGNVTQTQPQLSLRSSMYADVANYDGQYLILMLDPDAPRPEQPDLRFFLHWLAPNVTQSQDVDGERQLVPPSSNFVPYLAPAPGVTSSAHRYILYAFKQPDSFVVPAAFEDFAGGENRSNFNLTSFMDTAGLERPLAAEYFYVSRQAEVPGDFIGAAGGTYPGGNGAAIFENSPNAAGNVSTTTASGTATGSGASATATATSTSATAPRWWGARELAYCAAGIWGLAALL